MPIYEYECNKCGRYEVMQRITEDALTVCKTCGQPVRRLISETSFALKGGGWYKDLYSSSSSSSSSKSSSKSTGSSSSTGSSVSTSSSSSTSSSTPASSTSKSAAA
ncbi:MAG TPA: FmdB family transcriptional regulator [Myxococcales bacterium]|nr:FmdB family transcriptional regulator [Myxococcales bacterium]